MALKIEYKEEERPVVGVGLVVSSPEVWSKAKFSDSTKSYIHFSSGADGYYASLIESEQYAKAILDLVQQAKNK